MMIRVKRYERVEVNNEIKYFDRLKHSLINLSDLSDENEEMPFFRKGNMSLSVYPQKILKRFSLNSVLIVTFFVFSVISFLLSTPLTFFSSLIISFSLFFPSILFVPLLLFVTAFLHEISHAIVGTGLGGTVLEIGAYRYNRQVRFFTILFNSNDKQKRILYFFAGISTNMFLSGFGAFIFYISGNILFLYLYIMNIILSILNLLPIDFFNTDGHNIRKIIKMDSKDALL